MNRERTRFRPFKVLWVLMSFIPMTVQAQTPTPTSTPLPPIGDGFLASYYNNPSPVGTPTYTRIEESTNFNWFNWSPEDGTINADYFSARFTGFLVPPVAGSAPYTFSVAPENGGVSLIITNSAAVTQWPGPFTATYTAVVTLPAATPVPIELDYTASAGVGPTAVNLSWKYSTSPGFN
jgi:hypothetical protein